MWVGVGGYATSGKDAFADFLVEEGFVKTYMSRPLEEALLTLDPIVYCDGETGGVRYSEIHRSFGYAESKKLPEVRRLLQVLGTEVGRQMIYPDVWVDAMIRSIKDDKNAVVTGIRYGNELRAIRKHGGVLVWMDRPGVAAANGHTSEHSLTALDFDVVIENGGTLDDLHDVTLKHMYELDWRQ